MTAPLTRQAAIAKLVNHELTRLSAAMREDVLLDWWSLDAKHPEFAALSVALQQELSRSNEPEAPAAADRYDPLILLGLRAGYVGVCNAYLASRLGLDADQVVGEPEKLQPCPCCDYQTLRERGEYSICPVCFWEDTGAEEGYSSPNHMTLAQARQNFKEFGACSRKDLKHVDPEGPEKYSRAAKR